MIPLLLLFQTVDRSPDAPPTEVLRGVVVDAIRDCGVAASGQIRVCARDRGFAEGESKRMPKLVKPEPLKSDPLVVVTVKADEPPPAPR